MTNPLGKKISSLDKFSPRILFPISRTDQRQGMTHAFRGKDIWNLHEVIWINKKGQVFHNELSIVIDASSPYTVESKSLKLFVNSFIHKRFNSLSEVKKILKRHLEKLTKSKIQIKSPYQPWAERGKNVVVARKKIIPPSGQKSKKVLYFDGFRSLCPITNQPDNAKIKITGAFSNADQNVISLMLGRYHKSEGYHERCTEEILSELLEMNFNAKQVEAFFERRGGIAIIPVRHK